MELPLPTSQISRGSDHHSFAARMEERGESSRDRNRNEFTVSVMHSTCREAGRLGSRTFPEKMFLSGVEIHFVQNDDTVLDP